MKFFSLHFSNKFITAVGFQLILFKKVLNSNEKLRKFDKILDFINKKVYNEYTNSDKEIYQNQVAQTFEQVHK